jgi:3,4-dihydroxy-2-butanone 4-phosphate synthase
MAITTIEQAIADYRAGRIIIIADDAGRENEGDLAIAAEKVTPDVVNFMITFGRGLLCVPLLPERLDALSIPLMIPAHHSSIADTAFCISVDARLGVTTGISAHDRAATIRALVDPSSRCDDFTQPGHVLPLRYREGGVLVRQGHTEASVDLARLAGLYPSAAICEVMNTDGTMARLSQLESFADYHELCLITVDQLVEYRRAERRMSAEEQF